MLSKRVVACLDVRDGKLAKSVRFVDTKDIGDPVEKAREYYADGLDELVFYDITASPEGRSVDRQWVADVTRVLDIPFCVAGGIRSVEDAEAVLNRGADKISINSPAPRSCASMTQSSVRRPAPSVLSGFPVYW